MKKLVFASAMALAGICLVSTPAVRALSSSQTIQIQDPAEFNAYQNATTQSDPTQKCAALESFLKTYPQSTAKSAALDQMIDCYQATNQMDNLLNAATRLLQIDPNNMKAIFASVLAKKNQCSKGLDPSGTATDPQSCDDAAALAQKGLTVPKPADMSDDQWKTLTSGAYPFYHSAIAFDDLVAKAPTWPAWQPNQTVAVGYTVSDGVHLQKVTTAGETGTSKPKFTDTVGAVLKESGCATPPCAVWTDEGAATGKDYAGAIKEFTAELMLYPESATEQVGPGLQDTLQLAQAYAKPGLARDEVKACWFFARAWDFAPAGFKPAIEQQLDYWYKRYHGTLDGDAAITKQISDIKAQAQTTLFPPATFTIAPAPTPQELAHHAYTSTPAAQLNLEDIEYILVNGSPDDANGLWAQLKGKATPVPGNLITDPATVLKIVVTTTASPKPKEYEVKLANPVACNAVPPAPSELRVKEGQAYILANGVKADTDALGDVLTESVAHIHRLEIVPSVTAINVAVTQDARDNHIADFNVNLKDPLSCKDAPMPGAVLGLLKNGAVELDGTYDTYTKVAATSTAGPTAQIVLSDGFVQQAKKAPAHHTPAKPSAAHHER